MTSRDVQEQAEAPRSTIRESRPSRKFPNYMALMSSIIDVEPSNFEEVADQQVWHDVMVQDDVQDIVPRSKGQLIPSVSSRSTFIAKREC
jgi:hypothetical protein